MQQCRSTAVRISTKPELRLEPPSATVYRGDSLRIRCLSDDIEQSNGYSWTRNDALFQSNADTELWEDLYPDGSILKITNIQVIYFAFNYYYCVPDVVLSICYVCNLHAYCIHVTCICFRYVLFCVCLELYVVDDTLYMKYRLSCT